VSPNEETREKSTATKQGIRYNAKENPG